MTPEALARIMTDELIRQKDRSYPYHVGWLDDDRGLNSVIVDGSVDMVALASVVLAAVNPESST